MSEERRGDRSARSVLFLSFTVDHAFFESVALGAAQASGARVAVIGDAYANSFDPFGAKRAGRGYLASYAACSQCFHPKVFVLTGREHAMVAIGSANTTLSGWHDNAELWTLCHADSESVPSIVGQVATWLRQLPDHVRFSSGVPEYLANVADELDQLATSGDVGEGTPALVSNLHEGILEQLPVGPVDELAMTAPFHDSGAAAVRAIVERLRPDRVRICYQPHLTQVDGTALVAAVDGLDAQIYVDTARQRYRHGKLIEWVRGGRRYALTGSANLSTAALLRTPQTGGNCELAILSELPESLMPQADASSEDRMGNHRISTVRPSATGPVILGATRTASGLLVEIASSLAEQARVESSPPSPAALEWRPIGHVPAHNRQITISKDVAGGSRIRLVVERDGHWSISPIVAVVDPERAVRRPVFADQSRPSTEPQDLFTGDDALREKFLIDLVALRSSMPSTAGSAGPGPAATRSTKPTAATGSKLGWADYLDQCKNTLGEHLVRFALGLPTITIQESSQHDDDVDAGGNDDFGGAALESDRLDDVVNETSTDINTEPATARSRQIRARYRRWISRAVDAAPQLGIVQRLLVVRMLIWTIAEEAWEPGDRGWIPLLSRAVASLGDDGDLPEDAEPAVGSMAAVGLSILREHAPRAVHSPESLAFDTAATSTAYLLPAAEEELINEYVHGLKKIFGYRVDAASVLDDANEIVQADPLADAVLALDEQGLSAHVDGPKVLHVEGTFRRTDGPALRAIGAAQGIGLIAAWATNPSGAWTLLVWRQPDLYRIDGGVGSNPLWYHYRLSSRISPHNLAHNRSYDLADTVNHGARINPIDDAISAMHAVGILRLEPPVCRQQQARCDFEGTQVWNQVICRRQSDA